MTGRTTPSSSGTLLLGTKTPGAMAAVVPLDLAEVVGRRQLGVEKGAGKVTDISISFIYRDGYRQFLVFMFFWHEEAITFDCLGNF